MEGIIEEINGILAEEELPQTVELSPKTLERIMNFEKYIRNIEKLNTDSVMEIKNRKLTKVSISSASELNIYRKTLYNDKVLLKYIEARIENQSDYFNEIKIKKLRNQYQGLKLQYEKITDRLLDNSILQAEILQNQKRIEELVQDKNRLHTMLKRYENGK